MSFEQLNLDPRIMEALVTSGYTEPTPIQSAAIPLILAGNDIMASAQTGSGKTAAFMLPALHRLATPSTMPGRGPRVLVLTPTRELATQIKDAANKYGTKIAKLKIVSILGGMPYPLQNKMLSGTIDILIATPGRLLDHIGRGRIDFSRLEILVIDEADRMLDMGFIDDVAEIGRALPTTRQTLLFSATFEGPIIKLATSLLKDPQTIAMDGVKTRHENIEQRLLYADDMSHKDRLLDHLLRDIAVNQALVFTSTKMHADDLATRLATEGHDVAALHGDMSQRERNRTLTSMRDGRLRVLIATDVAARGLDVDGITHVINYDLPRQAEDYIHRIGRTGRAGRNGIAISFAGGRDAGQVRQIERFTDHQIPVHTIAGLEPRFASAKSRGAPRSTGGGGGAGGNVGRTGNDRGAPRGRPTGPGGRTGDVRNATRRPDSRDTGFAGAGGANGNRAPSGSGSDQRGARPPRDNGPAQSPWTDGTQRPRGDRVQRWGKTNERGSNAGANTRNTGQAGGWSPPAANSADPYDRQGDHFRAQLRLQEERQANAPVRKAPAAPRKPSGYPRTGPQAAQAPGGPRPYREVDDYGVNNKPRKMPKITVLPKKTREEGS